jgi:hypothetical protein
MNWVLDWLPYQLTDWLPDWVFEVFEEGVVLVICLWEGDVAGFLFHLDDIFAVVFAMISGPPPNPDDGEPAAMPVDFITPPVRSFFLTTTLEQELQMEVYLQHWLDRARGKPWGVIGRVRKPRNRAQRISHQLGCMRLTPAR